MESGLILLRDPLILIALAVLGAGVIVLVWCVFQLRSASSGRNRPGVPPASTPRTSPAAAVPSQNRPHTAETPAPRFAPPPTSFSPPASGNDASAMYGAIEQRFNELSKRVAMLEGDRAFPKGDSKSGSGDLNPVLKRLQEMEEELNKVKLFLVDAPSTGEKSTQDLTALVRKVEGLQKVLENLTSETEVAKPS